MVCAEVDSCGNASSTMQSEGCSDKSVICVSWAASGIQSYARIARSTWLGRILARSVQEEL
jgi:hypothetical protein